MSLIMRPKSLSPPARRQPNSVQEGLGFCFNISKDPIKGEYLEAFYIHFQVCDQRSIHKMEMAGILRPPPHVAQPMESQTHRWKLDSQLVLLPSDWRKGNSRIHFDHPSFSQLPSSEHIHTLSAV